MTDLETLKQTSLHDIGIDSLAIDFQSRQLTLKLGIYNEDDRTYDALTLSFQGINNLNLGLLELAANGFDALEIATHTVTHTSEFLAVNFLVLTGPGGLSVSWSFSFEDVRIS